MITRRALLQSGVAVFAGGLIPFALTDKIAAGLDIVGEVKKLDGASTPVRLLRGDEVVHRFSGSLKVLRADAPLDWEVEIEEMRIDVPKDGTVDGVAVDLGVWGTMKTGILPTYMRKGDTATITRWTCEVRLAA